MYLVWINGNTTGVSNGKDMNQLYYKTLSLILKHIALTMYRYPRYGA